jgi:hypothetical protein
MRGKDLVEEFRDAPREGAGERDAHCDTDLAGHEQRDRDRRQRPDRTECVHRFENAVEAGELIERREEVGVDLGLALRPHADHRHTDRRDDEPPDVGGATFRSLVGVSDPRHGTGL